jgi:exopolysaccharide biosynthesis protein
MKKIIVIVLIGLIALGTNFAYAQVKMSNEKRQVVEKELEQVKTDYEKLQSSDQILINKNLTTEIDSIQKTYLKSVEIYEKLLDLRDKNGDTKKLEISWAKIISTLAKRDYETVVKLTDELNKEITKLEASLVVVKKAPVSGTKVTTDNGDFVVNVISADLSNTKVIIDTAATSDCKNDCPVMPLGELAKRSGAFAAINSTYFCPATYPSCSEKKNSFDTLLMNKNKIYFNSDNNVYSSNPVAVFSGTSRFMEKGSEWGRDTSIDAVLMGRPLLVFNGEVKFGGNDDTKESARGNRSFIGASGNTVYIGIVYSATVAEAARVIAKMGIKNAINLDSGGSSAMWSNGKYLAGPGRDLPFGVLLVRR